MSFDEKSNVVNICDERCSCDVDAACFSFEQVEPPLKPPMKSEPKQWTGGGKERRGSEKEKNK